MLIRDSIVSNFGPAKQMQQPLPPENGQKHWETILKILQDILI